MKKITLKTIALSLVLLCGVAGAYAADLVTTGSINKAMPAGWTYITNNSQYPDPTFYSDGGLKFNFENMGIESPAFAAQSAVSVSIDVRALNANTKNPASQDVFTVSALNASDAVVGTATLQSAVAGANVVSVSGTDIVKIKVVMTGYPSNGEVYCNVSLGGVTISTSTVGVDDNSLAHASFHFAGNTLYADNVADGTVVEIYNALGAKVQTSYVSGNTVDLNASLTKGVYIIKAGKHTQKIMF